MTSDKNETLRRIGHEDKFREDVLMPLLGKMGLTPVHTHGSDERGKDIVCKESNEFRIIEWVAIVAKVGKITGSTSGSSSFQTVLNQVKEAFSYPYKDPTTKTECSINKVLVVTNDEILQAAKNKIVDKLGRPSAEYANVHFIGAEDLAELIDENWSDFWDSSDDLLADEDRMTENAGLVLYVLARAYVQSKAKFKKKVEPALSKDKIRSQTGLGNTQVDTALNYLRQTNYVEETKKKTYVLHPQQTVDYLLLDPNKIRLLFAITDIVSDNLLFTLKRVLEESKKQAVLSFDQNFVKETLAELEKGGYVNKDKSRTAGNFVLDKDMFDEERPYLARQMQHLGQLPTSHAAKSGPTKK